MTYGSNSRTPQRGFIFIYYQEKAIGIGGKLSRNEKPTKIEMSNCIHKKRKTERMVGNDYYSITHKQKTTKVNTNKIEK